jgi:hypothetical protein
MREEGGGGVGLGACLQDRKRGWSSVHKEMKSLEKLISHIRTKVLRHN